MKKYFISKRQMPYLIFELELTFVFIPDYEIFEITCVSRPLYEVFKDKTMKILSRHSNENKWLLRKNGSFSADFGDSIMIKKYRSHGLGLVMMNEMIMFAKKISPSSSIAFKLAGDPTGNSMDDCRKENLERRNGFYEKFGFYLSFKDLQKCNGSGSIEKLVNLKTFKIEELNNIDSIDIIELLDLKMNENSDLLTKTVEIESETKSLEFANNFLENYKDKCIQTKNKWRNATIFLSIILGLIVYFLRAKI